MLLVEPILNQKYQPQCYPRSCYPQGLDSAGMTAAGLLRVHPSFRMIGIAEPPEPGSKTWFTEETASMFLTHTVENMDLNEERALITTMYPALVESGRVEELLEIAASVRGGSDDLLASTISLSTRQLLRIAARMNAFPSEDIGDGIRRASLAPFLPPLARERLEKLLNQEGRTSIAATSNGNSSELEIRTFTDKRSGEAMVDIGGVVVKVLP